MTHGKRCGSPIPLTGEKTFGIGVGTLVLTLNATLLGGYTFGCHSFRHLVGGFKDRLSKSPIQKKVYNCASCLNRATHELGMV